MFCLHIRWSFVGDFGRLLSVHMKVPVAVKSTHSSISIAGNWRRNVGSECIFLTLNPAIVMHPRLGVVLHDFSATETSYSLGIY